jgi:hypothetical protein
MAPIKSGEGSDGAEVCTPEQIFRTDLRICSCGSTVDEAIELEIGQ